MNPVRLFTLILVVVTIATGRAAAGGKLVERKFPLTLEEYKKLLSVVDHEPNPLPVELLTKAGIKFEAGSDAVYIVTKGMLHVRNTEEQLQKIGELIENLRKDKQQPQAKTGGGPTAK